MSAEQGIPNKSWVSKVSRSYEKVVYILTCTILMVIVIVMGAEVFYRYVLNDALIWAEEVCIYLLILIAFIFVGAAFDKGYLASVQFLMKSLPSKVSLPIMIPIFLLMIGFLLSLVYYGTIFAETSASYNMPAAAFIASAIFGPQTKFSMSMYWLYMALPAGCLILCGHFIFVLFRIVKVMKYRGKISDVLATEGSSTSEEVR
jgi:TRAP-type C4-dicarboxylate transport system permease small subunit